MPRLYKATLHNTCEAFRCLKLFSGNCAEYLPTERQATQQQYVNHYVSSFVLSQEEWLMVLGSSTPLLAKRHHHSALRRAARVKDTKPERVKRHTFNKRRLAAN